MRSFIIRLLLLSGWGGAAALGALAVCAVLRRCHAPSRLLCWLWLAVGLRFALPGGIPLALPRPRNERLAEAAVAVHSLAAPPAAPAAAALPGGGAAAPAPSPESLTGWHLLFALWLAGTVLLGLRAVWSYLRLRRRVATACRGSDGCFGGVPVPFTLGILRPRIYLPDDLTGPARDAVRLHEQTHIRRGDTVTKPLFYALACLHWFNPLAWLAFRQFERAMESACDEAAVRGQPPQARGLYCESLLRFALQGHSAPGSLAFGQGSAGERIGHLLHYRRLRAGALAVCTAAVALSAAACMVRPAVAAEPTPSPDIARTSADEAAAEPAPTAAPPSGTLLDMDGAFANPVPGYLYISRFMGDGHRGDDLCAAEGTDILAAADGTVVTAGYHYSFGNYVVLDHGTGADGHVWRSLYAHMLEAPPVAEGQAVTAGQVIGQVGSSGNATGNQCHFQLYRDALLMPPRYFTAYPDGDSAALTAEKAAELEQEFQANSLLAARDAFGPALADGAEIAQPFEAGGHTGIDFAAGAGAPVYAIGSGTVIETGYDAVLGYYLRIDHGSDGQGQSRTSLYGCLQKPAEAESGQAVAQGQAVGYVGSTGQSTGPHLHLELTIGGETVDPTAYLPH